MSRATLPLDETERLAVLQALKLLDTAPDPGFDRIVRLARALSGADSAAVSLLDQERLWFKARSGVDACEIPRDIGFCSHAILESEVLWIEDARADLRFADNPLVTGPPHVRFYAGAPIVVDGRALGAVCVFDPRPQPFDATFEAQLRDLADLAAAEVQSRRAHQVASLSESIAAATADAILCGDRAGRITYWNKAAERMFGYTAEEALGRSLTLIIPERMRGLHSAGYAAVAAGGPGKLAGKPVEVPARRRDGTEFPAELSLAVWGSGSRGGVAAILRDRSERHAQMAAVEAARATMEQMVRNAPVSLVMTDRDLRVLEVSGRWSEFYGRPAEEARGQTMHDLFPDGRAEWGPIYRQGLEGVHGRGEQASSASGETRWFQWEVAPWRDAAGDVAGLLLMNIDVSETVRARKLAERAREAADAANRAKSEFLANMSHEVRTPLNGVLGMAGALAHSGLAPLQNEMVELIQSSASTLERMLMDMLELSRLESGPLQTVLEPLDLGGLARDAAQAAAPAARAKGLTFELHIDGGSDLVLGDGRRMRQVLDALLDNAIKFTDRGAVRLELRIEPVRGGARAVFRVSDTGVGFAPADKSRLFDVFEQADGSSTRRFGGSGLGLALCRSIARSLGGSLDAESTPSEGSTFTFSVECAAEPDALLDQNAA